MSERWECGGEEAIGRMAYAGRISVCNSPLLTLAAGAGALALSLLEAGRAIATLSIPSMAPNLARAGVESIVME